jgi:hypothetical protein
MALRFDEFEHGLGWAREGDRLHRHGHALRLGDDVWLIDAVDGPGLDDRIGELGRPAGVIQLLDRHTRDCPQIAARLGVPHLELEAPPGATAIPISHWRYWKEIALWFPEPRILVCADALGSLGYFRARNEPFGVHPLLRLFPPRRLAGLEPQHILFGHGSGYHGPDAPRALEEALKTSRRRLVKALLPG